MNHAEHFRKEKYAFVEGLLPIEICNVATRYALMQKETQFSPEDDDEAQVYMAHSKYGDTLMETLLYFLHPVLENTLEMELCPTYSYFRVYTPGDDLKRHKDRESCEISTTITLGYNYNHEDPNYNWGMYVDPLSDKLDVAYDENGKFVSSNNKGIIYPQHAGDVIAYRGCDIEHWRDPFEGDEGSYQVQVFCHFIDKNGPFYPEWAYDKRPGLGYTGKDK